MALSPALRKLRQENSEFEASLGYIVRPCLKNKSTKSNQTKPNQTNKNPRKY
jgi:hypothetical protein